MHFNDLQDQISALISEYNRGLDDLSDERVTTAQLHLARPPESCTQQNPGVVFVTPPEFSGMIATGPAPQSLSAAAPGPASTTECCAVGWKGVVWDGAFVNCFPTPGMCNDFQGPNRCKIPGT